MGKIGRTILEHEFLWLTLAVYTGAILQDFFDVYSKQIVIPFLDKTLNIEKDVEKYAEQHWQLVLRSFLNLLIGATFVAIIVFLVKML